MDISDVPRWHGPIALVGAPGSGKSTVGARLAALLGVPFADVDALIETRQGRTIGEIFADDGEPSFRALEEATTAELLAGQGVLSLGGGAVLSAATRARLAGHRVVWLRVGVGEAVKRVGMTQARPLLLGNVRGRLMTLLSERTPLYEEVATVTIDTDALSPDEVVRQIVEALGELVPAVVRADPATETASPQRAGMGAAEDVR